MSSLINALRSITPWYQNPERSRPSHYPAGLSLNEIEQKLAILPFRLPVEVYEIYQWCDGGENPTVVDEYPSGILQASDIPYHEYNILIALAQFFDLDTAISLWLRGDQEAGRGAGREPSLQFPLMHHENGIIVVVGSQEQQESSPVWDVDGLGELLEKAQYPSITNMMTAVAEIADKEAEFWADSDRLGYFDSQGFAVACLEIEKKYRN
jgi:hypothetical protein